MKLGKAFKKDYLTQDLYNEILPDFLQLRYDAGMSQKQVAKKVGFTAAQLCKLEKKQILNPSWLLVIRLINLYCK
jgi:DNA-binding XRE family transcriptional regulator